MLIRKNVNNDVSKDSPIASLCVACVLSTKRGGRRGGGENKRVKKKWERGKREGIFLFLWEGMAKFLLSPVPPTLFPSPPPVSTPATHVSQVWNLVWRFTAVFLTVRSQYLLKRIAVKLVWKVKNCPPVNNFFVQSLEGNLDWRTFRIVWRLNPENIVFWFCFFPFNCF